jgi:hypothetical protein
MPTVLQMDTPQRCCKCNEMKPAAEYSVNVNTSTGRRRKCKLCEHKDHKERYLRLKHSRVIVEREDKVCTSCGQLKLASGFPRNFASIDGLHHMCRSCIMRKAGETRARPPASK